jgi:hypothetical protein
MKSQVLINESGPREFMAKVRQAVTERCKALEILESNRDYYRIWEELEQALFAIENRMDGNT